jgi:hypothetical protein
MVSAGALHTTHLRAQLEMAATEKSVLNASLQVFK